MATANMNHFREMNEQKAREQVYHKTYIHQTDKQRYKIVERR